MTRMTERQRVRALLGGGLVLAGIVLSGCADHPDQDVVADAFAVKSSRHPVTASFGHAGLGGRGFRGWAKRGRHVFGHGGGTGGSDGSCGHQSGGGNGSGPDGTGGSGGALACSGSPPNGGAITGSASTPAGGTFTYSAPNLTAPTVVPLTSTAGVLQGLHVTASPGVTSDPSNSWSGVGLYFSQPACVDASTYTGFRFTVSGDLGTCKLSFVGVPSQDNAVANGPVGTCTATSCISPSYGPITTGTSIVHFTDLSGGTPYATLDPAALNDIGWQLNVPTDGSPACNADFIITDVSFINDTPRAACVGSVPVSALITDFSDAVSDSPGSISFANGGTFTYASTGLAPPVLGLVSSDGTSAGQSLSVSMNTGVPPADAAFNWDGFGLYFNMCTDASQYSGIQFTINGDLGGCPLQFSPQFSEDDDVAADPSYGSCTAASCYSPLAQPIGTGTTTVRFADLSGGGPMSTVDSARLTGVHWQVEPPTGGAAASCQTNFTVDNVTFVP
jgi:hypothetical protein